MGITGRTTDQGGNNGRYNAQLSVQRIDANQVISVIGNAKVQSTVLVAAIRVLLNPYRLHLATAINEQKSAG